MSLTETESQVTKRKNEERKEGEREGIGCGVSEVYKTFGPSLASLKRLRVPASGVGREPHTFSVVLRRATT